MKIPLNLTLVLALSGCLTTFADVIYLKNGSVLLVEKAWEEGDQIKYQDSSGARSIPRTAVKRIQQQKSIPADPSRKNPVGVEVIRGTGALPSSPTASKSRSEADKTSAAREGRSLRFQDSAGFQEAIRLHKESGKPIALYFYTDWCPYCARLEHNVLSRPEVKEYLEKTLYVSVNPEHGKSENALFASFKGVGYPTFIILEKDKPARQVPTAVKPEAFIQACKSASR